MSSVMPLPGESCDGCEQPMVDNPAKLDSSTLQRLCKLVNNIKVQLQHSVTQSSTCPHLLDSRTVRVSGGTQGAASHCNAGADNNKMSCSVCCTRTTTKKEKK